MPINRAFVALLLSAPLTACVTNGSPRLQACLDQGHPVAKEFFTSTNARKVLVGGIGPAGEVQCFWGEADGFNGALLGSTPIKVCEDNGTKCTFLANATGVVQSGFERDFAQPRISSASEPSVSAGVAWFLLGQFAQGVAYSFGMHAGTPSQPQFRSSPPLAAATNSATNAVVTPGKSSTRCAPITMPAAGQFPTYMCR